MHRLALFGGADPVYSIANKCIVGLERIRVGRVVVVARAARVDVVLVVRVVRVRRPKPHVAGVRISP